MRIIPAVAALLACLSLSISALAQALTVAPATKPAPLSYAEIVDRAFAANAELAVLEKQTQAKLKALSGVVGKEADEQRKELLIRRRDADRQAWTADRRLKLYWYAQGLPERQRAELADLAPDEEDLLLDSRTVQQRLFVPLPPKSFDKTPAEEVFQWLESKSDVRVVSDWPALTKIGVSKIDVVSIEVGRYDRPAMETLQSIVGALSKDLAVVDPRHSDSVLISTREGIGQLQERDRLLAARVRDAKTWTATPLLQPVAFTQVPLIEVLEKVVGSSLAEVHWDRLAALGIKPETPVSITLGVHRIGHAFALVTDVLNAIVQKQGAIAFDLSPEGVVILSDKRGLAEALAASDWLATAVAKEPELQEQLGHKLPDMRGENVPLADAVAFVTQSGKLDIKPDWPSLAASGLTEKTPITLDLPSPPASQALRLMFATPAGKPPVTWKVEGKTLVVKSAGG